MKKLLALLFLLSIISITYVCYNLNKDIIKEKTEMNKILDMVDYTIEDEIINLNDMYIYGNNLNFEGKIDSLNVKNIELLIQSYEQEIVPLVLNKEENTILFKLSNHTNTGLLLDKYDNILYLLFIKVTNFDNSVKYYKIDYEQDLTYYTMTNNKKNNKILINNSNKYNTLNFYIEETKDMTYDIILDPGHGGIDSGACLYKNKVCERDYTPLISKKVKEKLETYGYKVALTWDVDTITNQDIIPNYGENSRTGRAYETHAKYLFSIHLNSSSSRRGSGFEIYTPYNIDYKLAYIFRDNFKEIYNLSTNVSYKVYDGIYTRTFTTYDLNDIKKEREKNNLEPLDISTKTNYYFMIRETSGELGDAYVDGTTNSEGSINPYRDSKVTAEGYILELAYISNSNDVKNIEDNIDLYVDNITKSIITYLEQEKSAN